MIALLREQEAGQKTAEVCRKHGVSASDQSFNGRLRDEQLNETLSSSLAHAARRCSPAQSQALVHGGVSQRNTS